jgi:glutathione peroxidase
MNFHSLDIKKPNGEIIKMADYKGKAVLIVNTATKCGLTPQFKELEALHQKYKDSGLVILGMPCNQFLGQEPLKNENMEEVCRTNHGVTFQLTQKIDVNGFNTHPIFKFLKSNLPGTLMKRIKWNFEKFLINAEGVPIKRYAPRTLPMAMEKDISALLN